MRESRSRLLAAVGAAASLRSVQEDPVLVAQVVPVEAQVAPVDRRRLVDPVGRVTSVGQVVPVMTAVQVVRVAPAVPAAAPEPKPAEPAPSTKAAEKLGIGETKEAPPNQNPLEKATDDLLKDLKN